MGQLLELIKYYFLCNYIAHTEKIMKWSVNWSVLGFFLFVFNIEEVKIDGHTLQMKNLKSYLVLIKPRSISLDGPVGFGWCESSFELWCGPNNQTLVCLKTWVSVRFQVHHNSVHYRWERNLTQIQEVNQNRLLTDDNFQIHSLLWP